VGLIEFKIRIKATEVGFSFKEELQTGGFTNSSRSQGTENYYTRQQL